MKLDKKQLPQFIALGVLTAGVSGYTVFHFVSTGPVSAGTLPAAAPVSTRIDAVPGQPMKPGDPKLPAAPGLAGAAVPAGAAVVAAADTGDAPPPSPAMHDPFAIGYVDPGTLPAAPPAAAPKLPPLGKQMAALSPLPIGLPAAPPLPGGSFSGVPMKSLGLPAGPPAPALPAAPALPDPPKWTVTGVLMGGGGEVAILRNGEARRIVRAGDFVDSIYKVTGVSRTAVQLRHGTSVYHLVLGGVKPVPGALPQAAPLSAPAAPPKLSLPAMLGSAIIPMYHPAKPHTPLTHLMLTHWMPTHLLRQGAGLALTAAAPTLPQAARKQPSAAKVARAVSLGLRLLDGSVLAPRKE